MFSELASIMGKRKMEPISRSELKWKVAAEAVPAEVHALAQALKTKHAFPLPIAQILVQRGINSFDKAKQYFTPNLAELHDPMQMKDMPKAVERLVKAFEHKEKILIFGDYDVDGTTAVSAWSIFAAAWGFQAENYFPGRYKEGYCVSYQGIDFAHQQAAQVMIALDCGIKAVEKVAYANIKHIDVVICDHHLPGKTLPEAHAILDPKQADCPYPFKELTGCGIGYKLAVAVHKVLIAKGYTPIKQNFDPEKDLLDLLALSLSLIHISEPTRPY